MKNYVAVDIGASSGRLILGRLVNSKIELEEVHRFKNGFNKKDNFDVWNSEFLLEEILKGLVEVKKMGIEECTLGIDTWAVDYALLNEKNEKIHEIISYRDNRTDGAIEKITEKISLEDIYKKTGIQFQQFNTLFQLSTESSLDLDNTETILLVPDYLNYRLTGNKILERTNASTMQLINVSTGDLDKDLLEILGLKRSQFPAIVDPGTVVGRLKKECFPQYHLPDVEVIAVASHDTASAVLGTPGLGDSWAYLSSGTWSLLGLEVENEIINKESLRHNYTNELGAYGTVRFLKNIIGMWLIQEVERDYNYKYTPSELVTLASEVESFKYSIDVNDERFLNPNSMVQAIQEYCREQNKEVPQTPGEIARTIYDSLALCYKRDLEILSSLVQKQIKELLIVGGGGNISLLNQTIANLTGIEIQIGPTEATAIGNLVVQMITKNEIDDIEAARKIIRQSFSLKSYLPEKISKNTLL